MNKRTKQRNIIIIGLSCMVLLMVVGYAAFSSVLNINGTSNISSTWDVQITGITKDKTYGNVTEISSPTFDKESATFNVGLESPGNYIYYKIDVTNKGTLAAIAKLGNLSCGDNNVIECLAYADVSGTFENIETNTDLSSQRLIIGPGETEKFTILIKYKNDITEQPSTNKTNIKLELTYEQSDVGIIHKTEDKCYTGKVLKNGNLSIIDYDEKCGTEVVIPETVDGYTVTEIADGRSDELTGKKQSAFASKGITSVVLPNTIKRIGYAAFYDNQITELNIPSSVEKLVGYSFAYNKISNPTLNDGLTTIDYRVFEANGMTTLNLPNTVTYIGSLAFYNNSLTSIEIPNSVAKLDGGVFTGNRLTGSNAYIYGRNSDGSINYKVLDSYAGKIATGTSIPKTIETIMAYCYYTIQYADVEIPSSVKNINTNAFTASGIANLKLNEGLLGINGAVFSGNRFTSVEIPSTVTNISSNAFTSNPQLTSITLNKAKDSISGSPWGATKANVSWNN